MSKPSGTNYPKTFRRELDLVSRTRAPLRCTVFPYMFCSSVPKPLFWWLWSECSPLPIPNREVKPHIADDTALVCGKVGRRQFFIRASQSGCSFFCASSATWLRLRCYISAMLKQAWHCAQLPQLPSWVRCATAKGCEHS